jgi:F0F1-type ATP synthase membrane subunit c/vacuolar-type H+-ATPase subunit K
MGDRLDMDRLKHEQIVKRTRWLVWAESLVILGLLVWVSLEYENNLYLQSWAKANIGPVSVLLNGTLAGLYAGTMLGYIMAKYAEKKTEDEKILESLKRKSLG